MIENPHWNELVTHVWWLGLWWASILCVIFISVLLPDCAEPKCVLLLLLLLIVFPHKLHPFFLNICLGIFLAQRHEKNMVMALPFYYKPQCYLVRSEWQNQTLSGKVRFREISRWVHNTSIRRVRICNFKSNIQKTGWMACLID